LEIQIQLNLNCGMYDMQTWHVRHANLACTYVHGTWFFISLCRNNIEGTDKKFMPKNLQKNILFVLFKFIKSTSSYALFGLLTYKTPLILYLPTVALNQTLTNSHRNNCKQNPLPSLPVQSTQTNTPSTLSHTQTLYTAYSPKRIAPVGDRMSGLAGPESSEGLKIGTSKPKVASVAYNMSYAEQ
jgi:hypothetical protein